MLNSDINRLLCQLDIVHEPVPYIIRPHLSALVGKITDNPWIKDFFQQKIYARVTTHLNELMPKSEYQWHSLLNSLDKILRFIEKKNNHTLDLATKNHLLKLYAKVPSIQRNLEDAFYDNIENHDVTIMDLPANSEFFLKKIIKKSILIFVVFKLRHIRERQLTTHERQQKKLLEDWVYRYISEFEHLKKASDVVFRRKSLNWFWFAIFGVKRLAYLYKIEIHNLGYLKLSFLRSMYEHQQAGKSFSDIAGIFVMDCLLCLLQTVYFIFFPLRLGLTILADMSNAVSAYVYEKFQIDLIHSPHAKMIIHSLIASATLLGGYYILIPLVSHCFSHALGAYGLAGMGLLSVVCATTSYVAAKIKNWWCKNKKDNEIIEQEKTTNPLSSNNPSPSISSAPNLVFSRGRRLPRNSVSTPTSSNFHYTNTRNRP